MARRRRVASVRPDQSFKGRQFTAEVILWAVRWYLMFPISYRDLELMLADRGIVARRGAIVVFVVVWSSATSKSTSRGPEEWLLPCRSRGQS